MDFMPSIAEDDTPDKWVDWKSRHEFGKMYEEKKKEIQDAKNRRLRDTLKKLSDDNNGWKGPLSFAYMRTNFY